MQQLLIGLGIGLAVAIIIAIWLTAKRQKESKDSQKEIARLKAMITDRMDLESEGLTKLKTEVAELKQQNENLRISLRTYAQKPGRKEVTRLHVYQQAADRLTINSPGFGAAWQAALKESEADFEKTFFGVQPFIRKIIPLKTDANIIGQIESSKDSDD